MKTLTNLLRRGGKLLGEPCYRCGGVLVQYQGRTFCSNCDDVKEIEKVAAVSPIDVNSRLKSLASIKIEEVARRLESETDVEKQSHLAELLLKYISMLERVSKPEKTKESKEGEG